MSFLNRSSSSSQANQSTSTNTSSTNVNVQPSGGGASFGQLQAGGNVTTNVITSDSGAISDAFNFARGAVNSNNDIASQSIDFAKSTNLDVFSLVKALSGNLTDFASETNKTIADTAVTTSQNALQFGDRAFGTVDSALNQVGDAYSQSAEIQNKALQTASDAFSGSLATVSAGVQNALSVAAASTSSTYASTQTVKYVLYGLGAVSLAIAAIFILSRRS